MLSAVIDAAGGQARFQQVQSIETTIDVSGLLWGLKGYPNRGILESYVEFKSPKVIHHNLGGNLDEPNLRWIWTPDRVWVERANGTVLQSRDRPRQKMIENASLTSPWDDMDLLYFRGYALFSYVSAPFHFTWPDFTTRELENHSEGDQTWRVLEVTYPDDFPGHGKVQKYYYDDQYQLRRLDYTPDVINGGVAAHYCYDETKVDGLVFPTLRRAVRTDQGRALPDSPSLVLLNFHRIVVRNETEASKL